MNDVNFDLLLGAIERLNERLDGMGKLMVKNNKELSDKIDALAAKPAPQPTSVSAWQKTPKLPPTAEGNCPMCNKFLKDRTSAHGPFLACSGYPECKYTFSQKEKR